MGSPRVGSNPTGVDLHDRRRARALPFRSHGRVCHEAACFRASASARLSLASCPLPLSSSLPPTRSACSRSTPVGFEPTRGDPIGLAGRRLSHSAKVSLAKMCPRSASFRPPAARGEGEGAMSTPGVEPGLSRPRRDVLATRRCGPRGRGGPRPPPSAPSGATIWFRAVHLHFFVHKGFSNSRIHVASWCNG